MSDVSEAKVIELTVEVDENGNFSELYGCKKAFFAFLEDDGVYDKIVWPKGSYTMLIDKENGQITFRTDSRLKIVCGHFEKVTKIIKCPPGSQRIMFAGNWT